MIKQHENTRSNYSANHSASPHVSQRGRQADRTLVEGFRPLGIPAVAAAAKAMARRPESPQAATARRQRAERDDG